MKPSRLEEAESRRWAPKTRAEIERDERVAEVQAWWREQRKQGGIPRAELIREFTRRLKEAQDE